MSQSQAVTQVVTVSWTVTVRPLSVKYVRLPYIKAVVTVTRVLTVTCLVIAAL